MSVCVKYDTSLDYTVRDNMVESRMLVTEAWGVAGQLTKVFRGARYNVIEEMYDDASQNFHVGGGETYFPNEEQRGKWERIAVQ